MDFELSNKFSCDGKKVFITWKQAQTHNTMMRKGSSVQAKGKKLDRLHVYRCKKCKHFHLGHAPRKRIKYQ